MRTLSRLLVLLVVHGCVADTRTPDRLCTVANKQLCWDASSLKPLPNLPNITWQQLMKYCRRYPAVRRCEKQLAWNCTITTEKVYAGLDEEYKFMCADNGKVYAKHVDCLSTADLQTSEAACYKELRNRAEDVVKRNSREFVARFCQHTETYIDCTKNAVNSFCGKEASLWAVELNERSLSPLMVYLQCRDWPRQHPITTTTTTPPPETSTNYVLIGGSSAGAAVVACVIIVLLVLVRQRRRRVTDAEDSSSRSHVGRNDGRGRSRSKSQNTHDNQHGSKEKAPVTGVAMPNRQQGAPVSKRAITPRVHKPPPAASVRPVYTKQASLPVTFNQSQSAVFLPSRHDSGEAYEQLSSPSGDGTVYAQLAPTTRVANAKSTKTADGNDTRQTTERQAEDNVYQELLDR